MKLSRIFLKALFCSSLAVGIFAVPLAADTFAQKPTPAPAAKNPFLGRWQSDEAVIEFFADGSITINGEKYTYKVKNSVITVSDDEGSLMFPYVLEGDKLTVDVQGREVVYRRLAGKAASGVTAGVSMGTSGGEGIVPEFVGKWCYLSSLTGSNSYMSSRCFVLYQNGTYEYTAESSSSGSAGSTASQSYDSGRWTATRTTLTAYSNKNGKTVYPIELRNHPKNKDPMIVVDGDAYVSVYQKRPW
ncbi:MAG: hypothetical protein ABR530_05215 [Pyrinomonadaceae bacterium]